MLGADYRGHRPFIGLAIESRTLVSALPAFFICSFCILVAGFRSGLCPDFCIHNTFATGVLH